MGSGTTRKSNDNVIINVPQGDGGTVQDMNKVCPPSFSVKLDSAKPIPGGEPLYLDIAKREVLYVGKKVASITSTRAATITECNAIGFRYVGKVVNKNDIQYGIFTRV